MQTTTDVVALIALPSRGAGRSTLRVPPASFEALRPLFATKARVALAAAPLPFPRNRPVTTAIIRCGRHGDGGGGGALIALPALRTRGPALGVKFALLETLRPRFTAPALVIPSATRLPCTRTLASSAGC